MTSVIYDKDSIEIKYQNKIIMIYELMHCRWSEKLNLSKNIAFSVIDAIRWEIHGRKIIFDYSGLKFFFTFNNLDARPQTFFGMRLLCDNKQIKKGFPTT